MNRQDAKDAKETDPNDETQWSKQIRMTKLETPRHRNSDFGLRYLHFRHGVRDSLFPLRACFVTIN
jgi:hypothetical protein